MRDFSYRLDAIMAAREVTQQELVDRVLKLGEPLSQGQVSRMRRNKSSNPSASLVYALSLALDVSLYYWFDEVVAHQTLRQLNLRAKRAGETR